MRTKFKKYVNICKALRLMLTNTNDLINFGYYILIGLYIIYYMLYVIYHIYYI